MAKGFGGMSGGAPTAAMRPMPRPTGLGGVEVETRPQRQGGFLAQQFGPQGSEPRYDMAMEMLQAAMSGAAGSNNPALAFLTPLLGSVIGAKATKMRGDTMASDNAAMTEGLLGGPLSPQAQQATEVLNNPDAPDYLKQIAATMFKQSTVPVGGTQPRAGRSGGRPSGAAGPAKLTYIKTDPDGITRGYNAATGKREVVQNADAPALPAAPGLPAEPAMPTDPMGDDDLINKYLGL